MQRLALQADNSGGQSKVLHLVQAEAEKQSVRAFKKTKQKKNYEKTTTQVIRPHGIWIQ